MLRSYSKIKADARGRLLGNYSKFICALMLSNLLMEMIDNLILGAVYGTRFYLQFSIVSGIVIHLFSGLFVSGECYMYLKFAFDQPIRVSDLFHGFRSHADKAILLQTIFTVVSLTTMIPLILLRSFRTNDLTTNLILLGILLGGYLIQLIVSLNLDFAFYMIHDFPDLKLGRILRMCFQLMKGYRLKLLRLELSFIPMYLLGGMTFFVGFLWIIPYINATRTNFYIDLVEMKTRRGN